MSRIGDIMAERCQRGIEFEALGNVVRIRNGKDHKAYGEGTVPVYGTGGVMRYIDTAVYSKPSVLIPRKGSLSKLYYVDFPFWTVDTIFYTEIGEQLIPKFFYYFLLTQHLEDMNQAGGVPSLTQAVLNTLRIPVPPIEVQQEIVRILDTFTQLEAQLEAELETELEARRRQYAYYRDSLLSFPEGGVQRIPMGEFAQLVRGNGMPKTDFTESGIGAIHYGQIYTHYSTWATRTKSFVSPDTAARLAKVDPGDVVITNTSENMDDVAKAVAWLGDKQAVTGGHATVIKHTQSAKYLAYFFQTSEFSLAKRKYASGTKVVEVSAKNLAKIEIPVPPREEQDRIVNILDKFDALVNDLSIGLPAELNARRKQYEYYRDRLLTFDEAVV